MSGGHNIPVPRAGELKWRLTLLKRSVRPNGAGEAIETFEPLQEVWSKVMPWVGRDYYGAAQEQNELQTIFLIRFRRDIDSKDRVRYQGEDFNIIEVAELGYRQALELLCLKAPH
ncbi:MAG TPA: phage head closure protein [Steroidobacteraceae bacterium]|nr:phage head closure protein [Steroidobacteraceae bacterium]